MRILFLSNFYPPARAGGYTQWCHEIATGLNARGHTIGVLTSYYNLDKVISTEENIYRSLHLEGDLEYYQPIHFFTKWREQYYESLANLERVVRDFHPDILFVWGMWAMSKALPSLAERLLPSRVVYFISDYWPASVDMHTTYWKTPTRHWYTHIPKSVISSIAFSMIAAIGKPDIQFEHAICVSAAVRDILVEADLPLQGACVIHGGTDQKRFPDVPKRDFSKKPLRILYAGQLVMHKGVHTAIDAVNKLVNEYGNDKIKLTLVGSGHPDYEIHLRALVRRYDLQDYVTFYGPVSKHEMPVILVQSNVLVFPSIYEEPFARMIQEAMLAGMVVVGTTTGGTKEILEEGKNGLTFDVEDATALATQIERLANDPQLCQQLSDTARQTILERFTLDRMIDQIEGYLLEVVKTPSPDYPSILI